MGERAVAAAPGGSASGEAADEFRSLAAAHVLGRPGFRRLLAAQMARTALKLAFLAAAAVSVGRIVMDEDAPLWLLVGVPVLLVLATLAAWATDRLQASLEADVCIRLRGVARAHLQAMAGPALRALAPGHLCVATQRYPQALAALVLGHRTASSMMGLGPLMAGAAVFAVSWQAALLVLLLTPVMVVFFVLVGDTIRARADAQERAFGRLAGQFADRVRTLPTILANHALEREQDKLTRRLSDYAGRTMGVLRIAFLNAAVIDFFASLSIAMLAVFLGLGHLKLAMIPGFSNIALWQSLFILMIAPEFFAPFRRFSEQYHVKAEGEAAAKAWDALMNPEAPSGPRSSGSEAAPRLPPAGLVAVTGPSGAGKSTLLRRMVGVDPAPFPAALAGVDVAFVATDGFVPSGSVRDALVWGLDRVDEDAIRAVAERVGLLDDGLLPGGLDAVVGEDGTNLSGGQRLRLAIARAVLSGRTIVADEPTAKLDPATAAAVRSLLAGVSSTRRVVVATHDPGLVALADHVIALDTSARVEVSP